MELSHSTLAHPMVVCFDLGGVIVRICGSWEEACGRVEIPYDPSFAAPATILRRNALEDAWQRGALSPSDFYSGIAALSGGLISAAQIRRAHDAWILGEYPGMDRLIDALNRSGSVTTACLSNTNPVHWRQMLGEDGAGVFPAFRSLRIRQASHLLGTAKPSPEIYRRFEEAAGASGRRILFFDDREDNVETARRHGWRAHAVDPSDDPCGQILRALADEGILAEAEIPE